MYCYHCGMEINENKVSSKINYVEVDSDSSVELTYVCPRCGHIIHANCDENEVKSLSQAAHAEVQRARNLFAVGMGSLSIGIISLIISIIFYLLAKKPNNQFQLVVGCAEFWVFVVLLICAVGLISYGLFSTIVGLKKKNKYLSLLSDINNKTFVQ